MCGRFTLATDLADYLKRFKLELPEELHHPRLYNIAPSQPIIGLVADPKPRVDVMEWGFVPSWAKEESNFRAVINARGESVAEKPYFKGAFRSNRCAILADGFYEWKREGKEKHPYRIMMKDEGIFAMAGVRSERILADGSEQITCAIITTGPNELMEEIHDRMPLILPADEVETWLDRETPARELEAMIRSYPTEEMTAYEVSKIVNNPRHDSPECIKAVG